MRLSVHCLLGLSARKKAEILGHVLFHGYTGGRGQPLPLQPLKNCDVTGNADLTQLVAMATGVEPEEVPETGGVPAVL